MKKLAFLLVAVLFILAGCNTTAPTTSSEPQTTAAPATSAPSAATDSPAESLWSDPGVFPIVDEPVTYNFFAAVFASSGPLAENTMLKWYEEQTNVIINWEEVPESDQKTKLALSLASGVYPDAYFNCQITVAQQSIYGAQGVLIPLNDMIAAEGINITAAYETYPEILVDSTAPDGNIYSLFQFDPSLHMKTNQKMFINAEWVEQSGLGMPTTLDEFTALLEYFRDNDMNGNGDATDEIPLVGSTSIDVTTFLINPFILIPNSGLSVKDGQVFPVYTADEYRDALRYLKGLYDDGLLGSESFTQDTNALKALINRPAEMIVGAVGATLWQGSFLNYSDFADNLGYGTYAAVQPLVGPAGVAQTPLTNDGVLVGRGIQITKDCENPTILIKWMDYWYSEEGCLLQMRGIEGEHYELVNEPAIDGSTPSLKRIQDAIQPPITTFIQNQGPMFFTNELRYKETAVPGTAGIQLYDDSMLYMQYQDPDQDYLPFTVWMNEEQTRIISMLEQTITDYVKESKAKFIVGDMDIEADWDSYLTQLNAMELEAYIAIYQDVYDASK